MTKFRETTNREWARVAPLLATLKRGPRIHDERDLLNGVLGVLQTGSSWRSLPAGNPPHGACYVRFHIWFCAGLMAAIVAALNGSRDNLAQLVRERKRKLYGGGIWYGEADPLH